MLTGSIPEVLSRDPTDAVLAVLTRYVSSPTAQTILNVARQRAGVRDAQLTWSKLPDVLASIERSVAFFLADPAKAKSCRNDVLVLATMRVAPAPARAVRISVQVRIEDDLPRARNEAKQLAVMVGFSLVGQTRLMTAVSELARNIVQYAGQGQIDLIPSSSPRGVEIIASDRGPGIPNLEVVMSGKYRSKLGMGLGLLGVKRLTEKFDVRTEPGRGTTVTALMKVA
ncbi:MAG: ATP-binding protein [Polyangiales bacterium]